MPYDSDYSANMDWLRERYKLNEITSLYEFIGRIVDELKSLDLEKLKKEQSLLEEKITLPTEKKKEKKKCQKKTKLKKV